MKPPEKYLTDEASEVQYINTRWEAWQEDMKEVVDLFHQNRPQRQDFKSDEDFYYSVMCFYSQKVEQLQKEVNIGTATSIDNSQSR